MGPRALTPLRPTWAWWAWILFPASLPAQTPGDFAAMDGRELYQAACANCHGVDGTGADPSRLAFSEAMPDFTDCSFASREPDADWVGVAHEGGPVRGFSSMMPAFGEVLEPDQLQRVMNYVRSFCANPDWPRGELNFPRPMLAEKAYPEDEWVLTVNAPVGAETGELMNELIYEKRFGTESMIEVVVPFGVHQRPSESPAAGDWVGGLGDLGLGVKHTVAHSLDAGSIVSVGSEVRLPTGKTEDGFGGGITVFEGYVAYGQVLPWGGIFQFQGVYEIPRASGRADEAVLRGGLGRTFTEGPWGRAWTPMVEVQAQRELAGGQAWAWDLVPQFQVTLNTRQHVMLNAALLVPVTDADRRDPRVYVYVLWDWFDGGFFEGW